jgi:hypothetical protein
MRAFGAAIKMLPVAVLIVADDDTIRICNAACGALLGVPGDAVGRRTQDVDAFTGIPGLREALEAARTRGARRHLPAVVVHGAAGSRTVDVDVAPLDAGAGGRLVMARDRIPLDRLAEDGRRLERDHEARNAEVMKELQAANEALEAANGSCRNGSPSSRRPSGPTCRRTASSRCSPTSCGTRWRRS